MLSSVDGMSMKEWNYNCLLTEKTQYILLLMFAKFTVGQIAPANVMFSEQNRLMLTLLIIHKRNVSSDGCHGISDGANLLYTCEDRNTIELIEAVRQICSLTRYPHS